MKKHINYFSVISVAILDKLNTEALDSLRMLDESSPGIFQQLLKTFLETMPKEIAQLRALFAAGDLAGLSRVAHRFKSSCLSLGAMKMGETLKILEVDAKNLPPEKIEELVTFVEKASLDIAVEIQGLLK